MTYLATSGVMWLLLHLLRTEPLLAFVGELAWRVSPARLDHIPAAAAALFVLQAEQAARRKAEELLKQSVESEEKLRTQLKGEVTKRR